MEFRKIFDAIPDAFDKYRPRYSEALFADLIAYADVGAGKAVLELGPGTGQATEPILRTGCDYHAIELGEHLAAKMVENFGHYPNFSITCDDFITHDFTKRSGAFRAADIQTDIIHNLLRYPYILTRLTASRVQHVPTRFQLHWDFSPRNSSKRTTAKR